MVERMRGGWKRLVVLLLGTTALAFMAPQFAVFVPIVIGAWIAAKLGYMPRFLAARHESVRLVAGTTTPTWALAEVHVETEPEAAERAHAALRQVVDLASARLGPPQHGGRSLDAPHVSELVSALDLRREPFQLTWPAQQGPAAPAAAPVDGGWPALARAIVDGSARLVLEAHALEGRELRLRASLVGRRELLEDLLASAALSMRGHGLEAITTGWLRTAERTALARHRRRAARKGPRADANRSIAP